MKAILENLFHTKIEEKELKNINKLPLFLQGGYEIKVYSIIGEDVLFIRAKEQISFSALKKHWEKFKELTEMECVIYGEEHTRYGKERMIELGIPFIFGNENIYLPNLGIILKKTRKTELPEIERFSTFTQKLIIEAIYEKWKEKSTKEISVQLNVSRITVNRALVELQALEIPLTIMQGKTRYYKTEYNPKEVYRVCAPYFSTPIAKIYRLGEIPDGIQCLGGMSAMEQYSIIGDNPYKTYAVSREEAKEFQLNQCRKVPKIDLPACIVQVLKYRIKWNCCMDPISAILSLTEKEKEDPRVERAIENTLEEIWNGKWNRQI